MKAISCNQRNGGQGKTLCPGAPQGPARYQNHPGTLGEHKVSSRGGGGGGVLQSTFTLARPEGCFLSDTLLLTLLEAIHVAPRI